MIRRPPRPSYPYLYNFGLASDFQLAFIQPFLYFLLAALLDTALLEVTPKETQRLTGTASPDTGSLTQPDELLAALAQSRNEIRMKAACISVLIIGVLCLLFHRLDFIWHDPYVDSFTKNSLFDSNPNPAPDDYRVTRNREAMQFLFTVVISGVLCPVTDCLCRRGDGALVYPDDWEMRLLQSDFGRFMADEVYDTFILSQSEYDELMRVMRAGIFVVRIAIPCMATAVTAIALAFVVFGRRQGVVDMWYRRIERWVEAFIKERSKTTLAEFDIMWDKHDLLGMSWQAVKDEVEMDERDKEKVVWRRGMKEGRGYGPDYWMPREKGADKPFQDSSA